MKNKTYIQGFIQGIIEYYSILEPFKEDQHFGYDVYEVNDKWHIDFQYIIAEYPSTELDPQLDDSETIWGKQKIVILKIESLKELALRVTDVLDHIQSIKIETER